MFFCAFDQYSITILSGYLDVVKELAIRSHHQFWPEISTCQRAQYEGLQFATPRSYMFTFGASVIGHIDRSMLLLRCIALIMTLVASLSEHVKPGQVTLHVNTVLTRVVICNVYPVSIDFDPNCRDRPRSAL
jgi:hypothetical protein